MLVFYADLFSVCHAILSIRVTRAGLPTLCTLLSFFISGTEDDGVTLAVVVMLTESTLAYKIIINKKSKNIKPTLIISKSVCVSESYV